MTNFLANRYIKPGKGISKEEAEKRNYFSILSRHFWDMIKLNLLFFLCNFIFIMLSIILSVPYIINYKEFLETLFREKSAFIPVIPFIPFMLTGPFVAGLNYVLRSYIMQKPVFIMSDFFENTKKNWKQGLCMSIISTLVMYVFLNAVLFYLKSNIEKMLVVYGAIVVGYLLITMYFYAYIMIVTFDMKLTKIFERAWLFSMAKLPQNLLFLIIIMVVHGILLWYTPIIWLGLMTIVLVSWTVYTMVYNICGVLDRYILTKSSDK